MASVTSGLMTVEDFGRAVEHEQSAHYELRRGELVKLTFPKHGHLRLQKRLEMLLQSAAGSAWVACIEFPFRALPEFEWRRADVGVATAERWSEIDDDRNLSGAPEMVIEVLSPSNTKAEMRERAALCLASGAEEFWEVDPEARIVRVTAKSGQVYPYASGDLIPLPLFGDQTLAVDLIFASRGPRNSR